MRFWRLRVNKPRAIKLVPSKAREPGSGTDIDASRLPLPPEASGVKVRTSVIEYDPVTSNGDPKDIGFLEFPARVPLPIRWSVAKALSVFEAYTE